MATPLSPRGLLSPTSQLTTSTNITSAVLEFWKGLNLDAKRSVWDQQGLEIYDHQENSVKSRKKLADITKAFAKQSDPEKIANLRGLLKSYQEEVDRLTVRSKAAENAFLSLYKLLYEAPDPVPALAAAAEDQAKLPELEAANRKMRAELDEYKTEFSLLRNQDVTIRRLEEKCRSLESQLEMKVQEAVEQKENSIREEAQVAIEASLDRERELARQLQNAQEMLTEAQRQIDVGHSNLFNYKNRMEEVQAAKQSEIEMLSTEIERVSMKVMNIERERTELRAQLETYRKKLRPDQVSESNVSTVPANDDLELHLSRKELYIAQLSDQLRTAQQALESERQSFEERCSALKDGLLSKETTIEELRRELKSRPTHKQVEQLRNQIRVLQAVEYNYVDLDEVEQIVSDDGPVEQKLETLLMGKNRQLEAQVTRLKVSLDESQAQLAAKVDLIRSLEASISEYKSLTSRLEDDIMKSNLRSSATTPEPAPPLLVKTESGPASETTKDLGDLLSSAWENPPEGPGEPSNQSQQQNSMLAIVCAQRDRFRKRMQELETESHDAKQRLQVLTAEAQTLRSDNVTLYQKIRYLQSYPDLAAQNRARPPKRAVGGHSRDIEMAADKDAVEVKYQQIYEDGMNPFVAFTQKERQQQYKQLSVPERITLRGGQIFLSNKFFRTFLFFYSLALHFLVFLTLYTLSTYSCDRVVGRHRWI